MTCNVARTRVKKIDTSPLWHPKFWLNWLGLGLLRLVRILPFDAQLSLGSLLGSIAYRVAGDRRHIAETNIRLCFPDLSSDEHVELVQSIFRNNGRGILETAFAWTGDVSSLEDRVTITGLENLRNAASKGRGVLLVGMHFSTLDLCGAALAQKFPFHIMYRRNKNRLMEETMKAGRNKNYPNSIERSEIRAVVKSLKAGNVVWYGPDQDYGRQHSVFAPFFDIPAATITATSRITAMANCAVVVFKHRRTENNLYQIDLSPELADYPSGDDAKDATRINQLVEEAIREAPDQYWWIHRRFKTRPEGEERPY